jgi:hypothetical protein
MLTQKNMSPRVGLLQQLNLQLTTLFIFDKQFQNLVTKSSVNPEKHLRRVGLVYN